MKQRGVTEVEIECVLDFPIYIKKSFEEQINNLHYYSNFKELKKLIEMQNKIIK